jgi:peptidoglycan/xylan/chitin deacetylase (PgdA/CDA1 family)
MTLKRKILNLMTATDAFAPLRFLNGVKTPILKYHRFSREDGGTAVSRRMLREHLEYLTKRYKIVSLRDLANARLSGEPLPARSVVLTVDDGYRDAYEIVFPLLREFNAPATIFVVTDFLDNLGWIWTDKAEFIFFKTAESEFRAEIGGELIEAKIDGVESRRAATAKVLARLKKLSDAEKDEALENLARKLKVAMPDLPPPEYAPLTWDEAREMDANGFAVESHTVSHPILTNADDERLAFELTESRRRLENRLQRDIKLFCYPNGDSGEREFAAAAAAGYDCAVTTRFGLCDGTESLFALPRVGGEAELADMAQAVSGFEDFKASVRRRGKSDEVWRMKY